MCVLTFNLNKMNQYTPNGFKFKYLHLEIIKIILKLATNKIQYEMKK